jgi:phospholipase/carboxylesterase
VKLTKLADLTVRVAGGTDREGGGSGPAVILLHGFGASGDDLAELWRTLRAPAGTRFIFPEAPLELGGPYGNGRAWWRMDIEARVRRLEQGRPPDIREVPDGLAEVRAKVDALLGEVAGRLSAPPGKIALGGFSQGAMLSLDVALHTDRPLAGLLLLSGTHIAADEWAALYDRRKGLPTFMSHGREDPLLPYAVAEGLHDTLAAHGVPVEWVPFRGGHGIPYPVVDAAGAFLTRVLA